MTLIVDEGLTRDKDSFEHQPTRNLKVQIISTKGFYKQNNQSLLPEHEISNCTELVFFKVQL